ncbi:MAG: hypothetical protein OEX77_09600 [Candidatus Bathyarchaeota archaeon]|nr:hypothetical protein [Candidatus Bathyarchaeota archaeon]
MSGEEENAELNSTDYEALSALLDFHSDRAVAHASFLVACIFGLFTVLSLINGENLSIDLIYSVVYYILLFGGLYALFNFNLYATKAVDVKSVIEKHKTLLMEQIIWRKPKAMKLHNAIRDRIEGHKVILMGTLYFVFIGLLPWVSRLLAFYLLH